MSSNNEVDTMERLARWKFNGAGTGTGSKTFAVSDPFKMGLWNWKIVVNWDNNIGLFPVPGNEEPPLARYIVRVTTSAPNRRRFTSPITEKLLQRDEFNYTDPTDDFACCADFNLQGRIVIIVEFLDLQIHGSEGSWIWPEYTNTMYHPSLQKSLSRMLKQSIHTDVTINASDGAVQAHKGILCLGSPVFEIMLAQKESSIIDIQEMSSEACLAMLSFVYGCLSAAELWKHRMALLAAGNKYDIKGLKDACEESLLEDINTENVLERLQDAWLHRLEKLKKGCLKYLIDFGMIYDLKDDICTFVRRTDKELADEMFRELLSVWGPN